MHSQSHVALISALAPGERVAAYVFEAHGQSVNLSIALSERAKRNLIYDAKQGQ
jgi:hypothetical protein